MFILILDIPKWLSVWNGLAPSTYEHFKSNLNLGDFDKNQWFPYAIPRILQIYHSSGSMCPVRDLFSSSYFNETPLMKSEVRLRPFPSCEIQQCSNRVPSSSWGRCREPQKSCSPKVIPTCFGSGLDMLGQFVLS